ncbi:hypothetical protein BDK51DRAFT_25593 [Blyttiomyces helicus]|uniref:S1 motif domain-containing protein n=1 Tax=Blyttiomyces helicus TaxID=388810 RepID=A0A4P9W993_9FUNG|nr:hypothetical protein BDK51DRAFT_25593 [Blyttiomyces helicus]|eukprot:RKO89121.1 hypothetical protein BDK51DRAFT_25593 [Blyttiomyces helicus]
MTASTLPISLAAFSRIGFCIAKPTSAILNAAAHIPAHLLTLDVGPALLAEKQAVIDAKPPKKGGKAKDRTPLYQSSAQVALSHTPESLLLDVTPGGLLCCVGFPKKQIGKLMSDCLVTAVQDASLPSVDRFVGSGGGRIWPRAGEPVPAGTTVGVHPPSPSIASTLTTNPRNLEWSEFTAAAIQLGTISSIEPTSNSSTLRAVIDFGNANPAARCGLILANDAPLVDRRAELVGKQVLVLVNMEPADARGIFGEDVDGLVLTVAGRGVLVPLKDVANGFVLA